MSADIYWIPDVPSGRLAILGRPRAGDWLSDEIADWNAAGVTDVVSLPQSHEARELGLTQEADIAEQLGLSFEELTRCTFGALGEEHRRLPSQGGGMHGRIP
jgi:hypothetical protein